MEKLVLILNIFFGILALDVADNDHKLVAALIHQNWGGVLERSIDGLDQNIFDQVVQDVIMRVAYGQLNELGNKFWCQYLADIVRIEDN